MTDTQDMIADQMTAWHRKTSGTIHSPTIIRFSVSQCPPKCNYQARGDSQALLQEGVALPRMRPYIALNPAFKDSVRVLQDVPVMPAVQNAVCRMRTLGPPRSVPRYDGAVDTS